MEWISIKEAFPKEPCKLLVFADGYVCEADYGNLGDLELVFFEAFEQIHPTHWMPLPEPPKER
jgi:hypothetical protein